MRHLVGTLGVVFALAALTGCSTQPKSRTANDAKRDPYALTTDSAVGTTWLTDADLTALSASAAPLPAMQLPDSRLSLSHPEDAAEPTGAPTWGASVEIDASELPDERQ